jgi:Uma2 family endonuclease
LAKLGTEAILRGKENETAVMREALKSDYRTTIEAFHAFVDDRPEDEKWELIDGEIVLNPTANNRHQLIANNIQFELESARRRLDSAWRVHGGISTLHPDDNHNEPIPDVMIVPATSDIFNWTYDVLVAFEVLSPFSLRRDMVHKRSFYTQIEKLTHYIVLAQDRREATVFARSHGFEPQVLKAANAKIEIEPLGLSLLLAEIYRDVPLG